MNEPYYDKHTESFEREVNFSKKLIVSVVYAIIEVFGVCGNVLVILTICCGRRRFQTNYYRLVFQLAICDIVLLLTGNLMLTISPWIENHYWSNELMNAVCVKVFPLVVCLFHTELLLRITIALLRYKAVTQPFRPKTGAKKLKYIIAFAYIFPIFFSIPKFLSQQVKDADLCRRRWEDHNIYYNIYYFIDNVAVILVSLMFLVVLYTKMCYSIALHQKDLKNLSFCDVGNYHSQIHHHLCREKNTKMIV